MAIPAPVRDGSQGDNLPFLKPMNINKKGITKIILLGRARIIESQYGQQIVVECKVGGKQFAFSVKVNSGNHSRLFGRFGQNETRWKGNVNVELGEYLGKKYIKVCD